MSTFGIVAIYLVFYYILGFVLNNEKYYTKANKTKKRKSKCRKGGRAKQKKQKEDEKKEEKRQQGTNHIMASPLHGQKPSRAHIAWGKKAHRAPLKNEIMYLGMVGVADNGNDEDTYDRAQVTFRIRISLIYVLDIELKWMVF